MSNQQSQNLKRLYQLDGLRFPMICIIVMSHFDFMIWYSYGQFYWKYLINPVMAVDYFFMLSGFGLYIYMEKNDLSFSMDPASLYGFARDKVGRIYAPYVFSMIISIPYSIMDKYWRHSIAYSLIVTIILFVVCFTLFQSAFGARVISHGINGIGWFLSTLFLSYLVFPIVHRLIRKLKDRKLLIASALGCVAVIEVLFILFSRLEFSLTNYLRGYIDDLSYGSPYFRVFFLILGALIARITLTEKKGPHSFTAWLEPVILILCLLYFFFRNSLLDIVRPEALRLSDIILCALLIYTFSFGNGFISKLLSKPMMVKLGDLSMYVFLFHYPVRMLVDVYFSRHLLIFGDMTGLIEVAVIIVLTIALIAFYRIVIEKNLPHLRRAG